MEGEEEEELGRNWGEVEEKEECGKRKRRNGGRGGASFVEVVECMRVDREMNNRRTRK